MGLVERVAKEFCEHSGTYKWEDTKGSVRDWYLAGAAAAIEEMRESIQEVIHEGISVELEL